MELLSYAHPLLATVSLALAFVVFRDGFAQRKQRLRGIQAPAGSRLRHTALGLWVTGLMGLSAVGGVISAVQFRDWQPLATAHGKLGLVSMLLFTVMWWLGQKLVARQRHLAERHGLLGLLSLFAGGLTGILGIALLP